MKNIFFLITLSTLYIYSLPVIQESISKNFIRKQNELNLRDWLGKLSINIPNELIQNVTKGYIENLTIYNISLESIITTKPKNQSENKFGVKIKLRNAGINIKGKYTFLSEKPKNLLAKIYSLTIDLPFFLVKNESGLITQVDTTGFNIDIDNALIDLDLDTSELLKNIVVGILRGVLRLIKSSVIEKNVIALLNEKLEDAFDIVNNIIINGIQPDELIISVDEKDRADIRFSPIIGSIAYLLGNLTGANGPFSLNHIVNIFTYDTGIICLKNIYDKEIKFEFNLTNNNKTLGNFEFILEDLNISGLNTWKNFKALEPYDRLSLYSFTDLSNLIINVTFSLRVKLSKESNLVLNESILYEKANLRANLQNNTLNAFIQFPFNNTRSKEYTNQECLNLDCAMDLIDSNGTGITYLSLNETFNYILLESKTGDDLEEDLDETLNRLTSLFITYFNEQITSLLNTLLNTTVINLANQKINEFLYSKTCPGVADPDYVEINTNYTSFAVGAAFSLFAILIFFPYILGKACRKNSGNKKNLIQNEEANERISALSDLKNEKNPPPEAKYCIESISVQWIKEFGRTDPYGASLFLNPKLPLFFRIFIPIAILLTMALFVSSNSGIGASVFVVFNIGRRVQVPSLFDFGLVNSVHDMWVAGSWLLSSLVAIFSGIWPYLKLILMLVSFCLPASILSHRRREKILIFLDATGKYSILDSYVMIMMLVAFHFHVDIPLSEKSQAEAGSLVDVFVYAAYGFVTLILGTLISLCLSHIITHLHRSLDRHPDEDKGEKAESYNSIMSFAKVKYMKDIYFKIFISFLLILTLVLVIVGSITKCFSFYFHGLAGYALELLDVPSHREFSIIELGTSMPGSYENPHAPEIIFTQIVYFVTTLAIPLAFMLNLLILWFIPMPRKAQRILYDIAEVLNAWSCIGVFVIAIFASLLEIGQFAKFMVGDKCDAINPIIQKYFADILGEHDSCFEVQTYLEEGCWLFFCAAISFFVSSFAIMKVCRNSLNERLPDHVKEYLKMKKRERTSNVSNINDFTSSRESLIRVPDTE